MIFGAVRDEVKPKMGHGRLTPAALLLQDWPPSDFCSFSCAICESFPCWTIRAQVAKVLYMVVDVAMRAVSGGH